MADADEQALENNAHPGAPRLFRYESHFATQTNKFLAPAEQENHGIDWPISEQVCVLTHVEVLFLEKEPSHWPQCAKRA